MKLKHVGANDRKVAIKNSSDWKKVRYHAPAAPRPIVALTL
jgi:hypothetical protein